MRQKLGDTKTSAVSLRDLVDLFSDESAFADELNRLFANGTMIRNPKRGSTKYIGIEVYSTDGSSYQELIGQRVVVLESEAGLRIELFFQPLLSVFNRYLKTGQLTRSSFHATMREGGFELDSGNLFPNFESFETYYNAVAAELARMLMNPNAETNWTDDELRFSIRSYLEMLYKELDGDKYNKSEFNSRLCASLNNRSRGAVEWRHQNITAAMVELGLPYIEGYKSRSNYPDRLDELLVDELRNQSALLEMVRKSLESKVFEFDVAGRSREEFLDSPPATAGVTKQRRGRIQRRQVPINAVERESRNQELGLAGEKFVVDLERSTLRNAGRADLAERVNHVALTLGDGEGYDVLSYNLDGTERCIEVKTTKYGKTIPFFMTSNEKNFGVENAEKYHLYRVFDFGASPRFYLLSGDPSVLCDFSPTHYRVRPKK